MVTFSRIQQVYISIVNIVDVVSLNENQLWASLISTHNRFSFKNLHRRLSAFRQPYTYSYCMLFYLAKTSTQNAVKSEHNDHPRDPKFVPVVDRWSLFGGGSGLTVRNKMFLTQYREMNFSEWRLILLMSIFRAILLD